ISTIAAAGFTSLAGAQPLPHSILIFDQSDSNSPWGLAFRAGIRSAASKGASPAAVYSEVLELGRFSGPQYEQFLRTSLQQKYHDKPIGVVVVHGTEALEVFLRLRRDVWPSAPAVFTYVDPNALSGVKLPADITGTTFRLSLRNVVVSSRALVPDLKRIALVGTRFGENPFRRHFVQELPSFAGELEFIDLLGKPLGDVRRRLATLPDDAAVYYGNLYVDDAGANFIPADVVPLLAEVSNRPIVSDNVFHMGRGSAGGYLALPEPMAHDAAGRALRILDG